MGSALALNLEDYEIDSRVVFYEFELEAVGPSWKEQIAAFSAFQCALQQNSLLASAFDIA